MATSVSVGPPSNPLHHSLSFDDQDQYYVTTNDDTLCMEYLNEITTGHKSQSKYLYCILIFFFFPIELFFFSIILEMELFAYK